MNGIATAEAVAVSQLRKRRGGTTMARQMSTLLLPLLLGAMYSTTVLSSQRENPSSANTEMPTSGTGRETSHTEMRQDDLPPRNAVQDWVRANGLRVNHIHMLREVGHILDDIGPGVHRPNRFSAQQPSSTSGSSGGCGKRCKTALFSGIAGCAIGVAGYALTSQKVLVGSEQVSRGLANEIRYLYEERRNTTLMRSMCTVGAAAAIAAPFLRD